MVDALAPIVLRQATRDDLRKFYGDAARRVPTVTAIAGVVGGEVVGIGGIARLGGRRIAFCDLKPKARRYRVAIFKGALMVMGRARRTELKNARPSPRLVHAFADPDEAGAQRLLTRLGFQPINDKEGLYRWQD